MLSIPGRATVLGAFAVVTFAAVARPASHPSAERTHHLADSPYERAQEAFMSNDFAAAETAYRAVLRSDTVSMHERVAAVTLAAIAWRVRRDTAAADRVLARAEAAEWGRFAARTERSRMLRAWGHFSAARAAATAALVAATTQGERDSATTSWAAAVLAPLLRARLGDASSAAGRSSLAVSRRSTAAIGSLLPEAIARLDSVVHRAPGRLEPARLLVLAGALALNPRALLAGWRSYYVVDAGDTVKGVLAKPRRTFAVLAARASAARTHGTAVMRLDATTPAASAMATTRTRAAMIHALAGSRFFQAASAVALFRDSTGATLASHDTDARTVVAYASFLRAVTRATNEYYRRTALGTANEATWTAELDSATRVLWPALGMAGPAPHFADSTLAAELDRRFGTLVNLGTTAGHNDLHMGHRVVDERRTVRQYGHVATVRFVALDGMTSNGYQSWAWDGRAAHGGWGGKTRIVQVRSAYAGAPLRAWHELTDSAFVRRHARQIAADSAADVARARTTPVAYFPSVAERLRRDGRRAVLRSLQRAGHEGTDLEAAFEQAIGAASITSSIFAHEGRHAIDDGLGITEASELEYRAKLSEIAFATEPRLAFGGIMSANVGDDTPHGQANFRMLTGLLGWMHAHAAEIQGLDRSAPLLPQLPLLSDAQLRQATASLDPLARE